MEKHQISFIQPKLISLLHLTHKLFGLSILTDLTTQVLEYKYTTRLVFAAYREPVSSSCHIPMHCLL